MDELDNIVCLNDENGKECRLEFLDLITYQEMEYVVLLPEEEGSDEVVILKVEDDEDSEEESYVSVEDEDTLYAVFNIFKQKFEDEFEFVTDEE